MLPRTICSPYTDFQSWLNPDRSFAFRTSGGIIQMWTIQPRQLSALCLRHIWLHEITVIAWPFVGSVKPANFVVISIKRKMLYNKACNAAIMPVPFAATLETRRMYFINVSFPSVYGMQLSNSLHLPPNHMVNITNMVIFRFPSCSSLVWPSKLIHLLALTSRDNN